MMDKSQLELVKLDKKGLETLVSWAKEEGWNPGPADAEAFFAADPDGHLGYLYQGELIAGGSIISYGGQFGFMGLFIVKPEYRSHGIGRQLWYQRRDILLSRLRPEAAIGMDGVVAMQPFYAKGGFKLLFRDERYEIQGGSFETDARVKPFDDADLPDLLSYDRYCFGVPRTLFLNAWLKMKDARIFVFRDKGRFSGFVVMRPADHGYKVGPLFCDTLSIAKALLSACLNEIPADSLFLDIPLNNPGAAELAKHYQGKYAFECARMYLGNPPDTQWNKVFGITTFELG